MAYQSTAYYLIVRKGPGPGTVHTLRGNVVTIGRQSDNNVVIDDHRISRHHAQLSWRGTSYLLEDLGSGNGTWVNNARISAPVTLRPGDVIGLSQEVLLLFSDRPDTGDVTYHMAAGLAPQTEPRMAPVPMMARPPVAPVPMPPAPARSQGMTAFGIGGLIALVGALLLVFVGVLVYLLSRSSTPVATPTTVAEVVVVPTATEFLTPTPYPTYTPYPTATSTSTPLPTHTPVPTNTPVPTPTPYPTYTPYPTPEPTFTPYPTYTPYPTPTSPAPLAPPPTYAPPPPPPPQPPPPPPRATDTPVPTPTPKPAFTLKLGRNVIYEQWGRPPADNMCTNSKSNFDNRSPVRRLTIQLLVTNKSKSSTENKWKPSFYAASGPKTTSCMWYYNNTVISPGETSDVTFYTYVESNDYVQTLKLTLLDHTTTLTLDGAGNETKRSYK